MSNTEQTNHRPGWVQRVIARSQPPIPATPASPFEDAMEQYGELRDYAARAAEHIRESDEGVRRLAQENEALRREVEHVRGYMGEQVNTLLRENRMLQAYATNIRTRLTVIRESIGQAETEALQFAASEARVRHPVNVADEGEVREVVASIHRVNDRAGRTMPPANQM